MSCNEGFHSEQLAAAASFSAVLTKLGIKHVLVGGLAVKMLGYSSATPEVDSLPDVDFIVDTGTNAQQIKDIHQLAVAADERFSIKDDSFVFVSEENSETVEILIDLFPAGQDGLPNSLSNNFRSKNGSIPILAPEILVLSKIKWCVVHIDSTHPEIVAKVRRYLAEVDHILDWLCLNKKKIDFRGYQSADVKQLYQKTKELIGYWRRQGYDESVGKIASVLNENDYIILLE